MAKFEERFGLEVKIDEARQRFVNRVHYLIFSKYPMTADLMFRYREAVTVGLGIPMHYNLPLGVMVGKDYHNNLKAIESIYAVAHDSDYFERLVHAVLSESEIDLGIRWEKGMFVKAGAPLLDEKLVRDVLGWAREKKHETVLAPFEKGLRHLLESAKRPDLLSDVVTDMYEALEATAKIVTKRDADLSGNRERFIKAVRASDSFKRMLKEYVDFGCQFRHAGHAAEPKPALSPEEVESFIYLTGIFIRFAMNAS